MLLRQALQFLLKKWIQLLYFLLELKVYVNDG
jgi:hypothetical protein